MLLGSGSGLNNHNDHFKKKQHINSGYWIEKETPWKNSFYCNNDKLSWHKSWGHSRSAHGLRNSHGTCIPMEYDKMEDKQLQETSNDEHCWQGIDEWG